MKVSISNETASFTVRLSNAMSVTIYDAGCGPDSFEGQPGITVRQEARDLMPGCTDPDYPRYDMGGTYELALPDVTTIGDQCSERDHDVSAPDFPREGMAAIDVRHIHN
jgi:hypothetical protein